MPPAPPQGRVAILEPGLQEHGLLKQAKPLLNFLIRDGPPKERAARLP